MNLAELLKNKTDAVAERWLDAVYDTYQPETARFLRREKDMFANPVGHAVRLNTPAILGELAGGMDAGTLCVALDEIIKVRAIQDFSPSQALSIVFSLKTAVREALGGAADAAALAEFDRRVDQTMLFAIDVYSRRREAMYQLRVDEVKRHVAVILKRSGLCAPEGDDVLDAAEGECTGMARC